MTIDTIQQGDTGQAVTYAQFYLVIADIFNGPPDVDGIFGPQTDNAVRKYQAEWHLNAIDGIVGPETWSSFVSLRQPPPILGVGSIGSTGETVRDLQRALNHLAREEQLAWTPLDEDGDYGPLTEAGVRTIQGANDCSVDGVVGPQTWTISLHAAGQRLVNVVNY